MPLYPLLRPLLSPLLQPPLNRTRPGGGGAIDLRTLLFPAGTEAGMFLAPWETASAFQDSAGATPGAVDQPVGLRLDRRFGATALADPGNHVLQSTSAARPLWKLDSSIYSDLMDGTDDGYATATFTAGTLTANMDCFIAIKRASTARGVSVCENPASFGAKYFGYYDSAAAVTAMAGGAGTPTHYVNGVSAGTTGADLNTALVSGQWRIYEVHNLDMSLWTRVVVSLAAGYPINGNFGGLALCPAKSDTIRAQVRTALGAKVGVSL